MRLGIHRPFTIRLLIGRALALAALALVQLAVAADATFTRAYAGADKRQLTE